MAFAIVLTKWTVATEPTVLKHFARAAIVAGIAKTCVNFVFAILPMVPRGTFALVVEHWL